MKQYVTGSEIGLSGEEQIKIALNYIYNNNGIAQTKELYPILENNLKGKKLSDQGKASFRFFINGVAVRAGLIHPYDKNNPGWRITKEGIEYLNVQNIQEITINTETDKEESSDSNTARGLIFEKYILELLNAIYPNFIWHHQGLHKKDERGLDFIGDRLGEPNEKINSIGVQVKYHKTKNSPTQIEWLKFLSGCFARRVDNAIFITTGRLKSEQYREAREANVLVIQGKEEINRIAKKNNLKIFEYFENDEGNENEYNEDNNVEKST